ncbi:MAG: hypothetical protein OEV55_01480 [candidate division Zixibacteria bacterium]|nr:hypothetical protein [candidate division Zixibacteria bacterium]
MQKKQILIIGLVLIGVVVLYLVLKVSEKKKEDSRAVFQTEIIVSLKEGYSVKDTIFESLDGVNQQVVALIHWESKDGFDQQDSLAVFESKGGKLAEIFNSTDWVFELGNGFNGDYFRAEDINKDNLKEFVITRSQGGNCWTCSSLRVFQVKDHKVIEFLSNLPETQVIYGIMDLNKDGIKELIILDAEWEANRYLDLCHACSPAVDIIYAWRMNKYVESSIEFPFYYDEKIREYENEIRKMDLTEQPPDYYTGRVISIFLNYLKKGDKKEGWNVLRKYLTDDQLNNRVSRGRELADDVLREIQRRHFAKP